MLRSANSARAAHTDEWFSLPLAHGSKRAQEEGRESSVVNRPMAHYEGKCASGGLGMPCSEPLARHKLSRRLAV